MTDDTTLENRSKQAEGEKRIAAPDQHAFWAKDADYGATPTLPSLFEKELAEDDLLKDPRWIKASREVYKLNNKDDSAALAKLNSMSDAEIAQEGISYYGYFNYNMTKMGYETAQFVKDATPEQKKAFLFMMDAYDHKSQSLDGWGRAALGMVTDPLSYVGISTLGVGLAAKEGAKTAAKISLKEILKKAVTTGLTAEVKTELKNHAVVQTIKTGAKIGFAEGALYAAADDTMRQKVEMDTAAANGALINDFRNGNFSFSRLLEHTGYGAAFGGTIGAAAPVVMSAIGKRMKSIFGFNASPALKEVLSADGRKITLNADGTVHAIDGEHLKGPGKVNFIDGETIPVLGGFSQEGDRITAGNTAPLPIKQRGQTQQPQSAQPTPAAQPGNTGGQGQGGTTNIYNGPVTINQISGAAPAGQAAPAPHTENTAAAAPSQPSATAAPEAPQAQPTTAPAQATPQTQSGPASGGNGGGNQPPTNNSTANNANANNGGGPTPPPAAASAAAPTGSQVRNEKIDLPKFEPGLDWHRVLGRIARPFLPRVAYQIRSQGITEPVIKAVDSHLQDLGLVGKLGADGKPVLGSIQKMHNDILGSDLSDTSVKNIFDKFTLDNLDTLTHFKASITELKDHIIQNYGEKDRNGKPIKYDKYFGKTGHRFGLNIEQKNTLLSYLDVMSDMADDLMKSTNGTFGKEIADNIAKTKSGDYDFSIGNFKDSATGLSRAHMLANDAFVRLTNKTTAGSNAVSYQWKKALVRAIDTGFIDDFKNPFTGKPLMWDFLASTENLERTWQNHGLTKYLKRDKNGEFETDWNAQGAVGAFIGVLDKMRDVRFSHEAIFTMRQMVDSGQRWGSGDQMVTPGGKRFEDEAAKVTSQVKKDFISKLGEIANIQMPGRHYFGFLLRSLPARYTDAKGLNRENILEARALTYRYEYFLRWPSATRSFLGLLRIKNADNPLYQMPGSFPISLPGNLDIQYYLGARIAKFFQFFGGAYEIKPTTEQVFGLTKKGLTYEPVWREKDADGKKVVESSVMLPIRATTRILSGGLLNNVTQRNPLYWLSVPGWAVAAGVGAEAGYEYSKGHDARLPEFLGGAHIDVGGRAAEVVTFIPYTAADLILGNAARYTGRHTDVPYLSPWLSEVSIEMPMFVKRMLGDRYDEDQQTVVTNPDPAAASANGGGGQDSSGSQVTIPPVVSGDTQPPSGGGGSGGGTLAPQTTPDTRTAEQEAQIRADEAELKGLDDKANRGETLTSDEAIRRTNLEAEKRAAQSQAKTKTEGKPLTSPQTMSDTIKRLNEDRNYIAGIAVIDPALKAETLRNIEAAIAALDPNPNDAALKTAMTRIDDVNKIRTGYSNISEALAKLRDFEQFSKESKAPQTLHDDIKAVREMLIAAKHRPHESENALSEANRFLDEHGWDKPAYYGNKALKSAWDSVKTSEFDNPDDPLFNTFTNGGSAIGGGLKGLWDKGVNYTKRIWSGKEGATAQTLMKFGGGLAAGILAIKIAEDWIDSTPILNLPILKQLIKLALFVGVVMGVAKWMENGMDTQAAIQTSGASKHVPDYMTPRGTAAEGNQPPGFDSTKPSGASVQPHKNGSAPKAILLNSEQNAVLKATQENAGDPSGSASQGPGHNVAYRELDNSAYIKVGKGNHFPVKDPSLGHGVLGREQIPHNDNADGSPPGKKVVVLDDYRTDQRPEYALAGPAMEM